MSKTARKIYSFALFVVLTSLVVLSSCDLFGLGVEEEHVHTYDSTYQLCSCGQINPNVVATIKDSSGKILGRFLTLQEALNYAESHSFRSIISDFIITLLKDVQTETITISNSSIIIDLASHSIITETAIVITDSDVSFTGQVEAKLECGIELNASNLKVEGSTEVKINSFEGTQTSTVEFSNSYVLVSQESIENISKVNLESSTVVIKVENHEHSWTSASNKTVTCEEDGYIIHLCSDTNCGYKYTQIIAHQGHKWSDWVVNKESTEISEGSQSHECSVCHEVENQGIPKKASNDSGFVPVEETDKRIISQMNVERLAFDKVKVILQSTNSNTDYSTSRYQWAVDLVNVKTEENKSSSYIEYTIPDGGTHIIVCSYSNAFGSGNRSVEVCWEI